MDRIHHGSLVRAEPLPSNPNCVSFATDAEALFGGRPWSALQSIAAAVVGPFHEESRLPSAAGYSWRVALDRRNERRVHGQLYVVFDGPATSGHLDRLEERAAAAGLGFGSATVERVPANGALAVYAFGARCHALWSGEPASPWLRKLAWGEGRVLAEQVARTAATPEDVAAELPGVVGLTPPYSEAEREAERMRLAFALRLVDRIVHADGEVKDGEARFRAHLFPPDLLGRLGLDEPARQQEYFQAALEALPVQLGHHDKLALVGLFFSACCSDGSLDAREMRVLREGGELLGLSRDQVVKYLRRFW